MSSKMRELFEEAGIKPPADRVLDLMASSLQTEAVPKPRPESAATLQAALQAKLAATRDHKQDLPFRMEVRGARQTEKISTGAMRWRLAAVFALVAPQVHLFGRAFWLSTAVIMSLGILLTTPRGVEMGLVPLFLVAPLLAVLSVSHAFRAFNDRVAIWEKACPISPVHMMWARMVLVVLYNIGLSCGATLFVLAKGLSTPWPVLVSGWLGPLMGLAGVTLLISLRFSSRVAAAASMVIWLIYASVIEGGRAMLVLGPALAVIVTLGGVIFFLVSATLGIRYYARRWSVPLHAA